MTQSQPNTTNTGRSVALHIGAHKTATTHMQQSLDASEERLAAQGVRFYGPRALRQERQSLFDLFNLQVSNQTPKPSRSRADQLNHMLGDGHRLVLSNENFVGTLNHGGLTMPMPLYPHTTERVRALASALDCGPIEVYVGIRNPTNFLVSSYSQALMGGSQVSFAEYVKANPVQGVYWPGLIARLRATPGVGSITVWRYGDYKPLFHQIMALMTGCPGVVEPAKGRAHRGLSQRAVDEVLSYSGPEDIRDFVRKIRDQFPAGVDNKPFRPLSEAEHVVARADFNAQLAQIRRLSGVRILQP